MTSLRRMLPFSGPAPYALWAAAFAAASFVVPAVRPSAPWPLRAALPIAVSASVVVAILVGIRRHRPPTVWPWLLLAAARTAYAVGDLIAFGAARSGRTLPFPSVADALYLAHYPLLIAAVVGLLRRPANRKDTAALIDASLVALSVGLVAWLFVLRPQAVAPGPAVGRVVGMLYVVLDVATLTVALRLTFRGAVRTFSMRLLTFSIALLLCTDIAYNAVLLYGSYQAGGLFDLSWFATYVLVGTAALHPSMTGSAISAAIRSRVRNVRLAVLAAAALLGPLLGVVHGEFTVEIAACSGVLSLLVVLRLAGVLKAQAAAQAERAVLLAQVLEAREHERTFLALELHDGPIQRLAALGLCLDSIDIALDGTGSRLQQRVAQIRDGLHREIADLRRMMTALRPPALDHGDLAGALADYLRDHCTTFEVDLAVALDDTPVDPDVETALYRVAQEALSNVRKHSGARHVRVRLWSDGALVGLVVTDDGGGFDADQTGSAFGHVGLAAMRERTEQAGGVFRLDSSPSGTTVRAAIPARLSSAFPSAPPPDLTEGRLTWQAT